MRDPILDVRSVSRFYGGRPAVQAARFALAVGQVTCLLGPSGCGKSTLLRMIAGLEPVDAGEIQISGTTVSSPDRHIAPESRGVGLVFQDMALFPHLDVAGNVGFGLDGLTRTARSDRVAGLLARFHVGHLARAWPHTLSGGEQQRVATARALAREPALLLLDEPFSGLDGQLRTQVRNAMLADLRATGTTILIVTHDPEEAMQIADRIVLMSEGHVLQTGRPEECYRQPVSVAAARLLGEATILPANVAQGVAQTLLGPFGAPGLPDGPAEVMIRPEAMRLDPARNDAEVKGVRFAGRTSQADVRLRDLELSFPVGGVAPQLGQKVGVAIDPAHVCVYPAN